MIGFGLIGTGRIGRIHAQTLAGMMPAARLVAVTDVNRSSAEECAQRLGLGEVVDDVDALLAHPDVQAVAICSSTETHSDLIRRSARAGKQIFCEKPIDSDLQRIDAVLQEVEQAGVQLMIGFNRRFDANHQRLREAVVGGEIGEPHLLHIISRDPAPPPLEYVRVSGGLFFDMTIHDFDMARFLFGDVEELYAVAGVRVDPAIGAAGDVDTALVTLKFANGAFGTIDNSRQAVYGYDQRVELFGSGGAARSENVFPHEVSLSSAKTVQRGLPKHFFLDRYLASYQAEMRAFVESLRDRSPSPVSGADARVPVVMAMAARRSLEENRPVRLAEIR